MAKTKVTTFSLRDNNTELWRSLANKSEFVNKSLGYLSDYFEESIERLKSCGESVDARLNACSFLKTIEIDGEKIEIKNCGVELLEEHSLANTWRDEALAKFLILREREK